MVFSLSALWWRRIRGLWKLPDGRDWQRGKLGLVLMGGAMLSKSLIQFSVDGWGCVPSLLFTWGQTLVAQRLKRLPGMWETWVWSLSWEDFLVEEMATHSSTLAWRMPWREEPGRLQSMGSQRVGHDWVTFTNYGGGNEDNGDLLQKLPCTHCHTQCPLTLQQATAGYCRPMPPLETPGHSQASLGQSLVGSLLVSPGSWCTQVSVCALQESISQSCVSSGSSIVELMETSSKRAYAVPKSAAPRAPAAVHCRPIPPQETLKQSSVSVSVGSLGPGAHKVCLNPLSVSGVYEIRF